MARKARLTRVQMNRRALLEVDRALVAGLEAVAQEVIDVADVPDAPPIGQGLIERGGWISYVAGKKVGAEPRNTKKPKGARIRGRRASGVSVFTGWGFPARFQEFGTVNQKAKPFATPTVMRVAPQSPRLISRIMRPLLPRPRNPRA